MLSGVLLSKKLAREGFISGQLVGVYVFGSGVLLTKALRCVGCHIAAATFPGLGCPTSTVIDSIISSDARCCPAKAAPPVQFRYSSKPVAARGDADT